MKNKKWAYLGAAFLGVLLVAGLSGDVVARAISKLSGESLRIGAQEGRGGSPTNTISSGDAYIQGILEVDEKIMQPAPAVQALAASFTITADACGGIKLVSATATVTSDTTNTFTAAATAGSCQMLVINTGTNEILLDANTEFPLPGSVASLRLASGGSVLVYSNGTTWYHGVYTEY